MPPPATGAEGVHEQDLSTFSIWPSLMAPRFGCETDGGAHCVEERGDEDGEDQQNGCHAAEGAEGTEQVSGAEQGEVWQLVELESQTGTFRDQPVGT